MATYIVANTAKAEVLSGSGGRFWTVADTSGGLDAVDSGDLVIFGAIVGIAQGDYDTAKDWVVLDLWGNQEMAVVGEDGAGNAAIAIGDWLYYEAGTPAKINLKPTGICIGRALGAVLAGATTTIGVQIMPVPPSAQAAIETAEIADDAVTAAKLAANAVETEKILDANVTAAKLAANAVETEKIAADAVNTDKLDATIGTLTIDAADGTGAVVLAGYGTTFLPIVTLASGPAKAFPQLTITDGNLAVAIVDYTDMTTPVACDVTNAVLKYIIFKPVA